MENIPTIADIGRGYAEWLEQKEKAQKEAKAAKEKAMQRARLESTRKRALEEDIEPAPVLEEYELISAGAKDKSASKEDIAKSILSPKTTLVCYYIGRKGGRCRRTANLRTSRYVFLMLRGVPLIKVKHCTLHHGEVHYNNDGQREEQQELIDELVELGLELAKDIAPERASWLEPSLAEEIAGAGSHSPDIGRRKRRPNSPDSDGLVSGMNGVALGARNPFAVDTTAPATAPPQATATAPAQATATAAIPTAPPPGQAKRYTRASAAATNAVETPNRGAAIAHKAPEAESDGMDVS